MTNRDTTRRARWVIKIGSALITNNGNNLAHEALDKWVPQIARLVKHGHEIVLVSSGAVAEGMHRLGWQQRPGTLHDLQTAAAVGQAGLIQSYETRFQQHSLQTAQILLVHDDLSSRTRYLNARQTINSILSVGAIPIVNENDTVATDEIRFGDNDTLAGLVANLIDADTLLILTDQDGLYDDDPRTNPQATLIDHCDVSDPRLDEVAKGSSGTLGRGGMTTKIRAARFAARSGTTTIIANGNVASIIEKIAASAIEKTAARGTTLTNNRKPITARKQWLAGSLQVKGQLSLDAGAVRALCNTGVSLLPVGLTAVQGDFARGELVSCLDPNGAEVARGLVNYSSEEARLIIGKASGELQTVLGYAGETEIIHRNDLVVL